MSKNIKVNVPTNEKQICVDYSSTTKAEELCSLICRKLCISQIATTLFSLQLEDQYIYLHPNALVEDSMNNLSLRIRYRVPSLQRLKSLDTAAYNFYFFQVRNDVLENKVPEIIYAKHRDELLGLGIADMYRAMLDEGKTCEEVEKEYKRYIPREVLRKHSIFTKKPIHTTLSKIEKTGRDAGYVKDQYLKKFYLMAPNYLSEEYDVYLDKSGCLYDVKLHVMPFHKEQPGLRIYFKSRQEFEHLCTIDELCFMSTRHDGTIEISRRNGIPVYVKFNKPQEMFSFISVCDGYYRLMVKWTFNLCKEVTSPFLQKLHNIKCHGPVGGVFSYRKLEDKRSNKPGCYILRQCEKDFDTFFIDVCSKNSTKPETYTIKNINGSFVLYDDEEKTFDSLSQLIQKHNDPEEKIHLIECLPPSEYDKSQALLCEDLGGGGASRIDPDDLDTFLANSTGPRCINSKDIFVFKTSRIAGSENLSVMYKALWQVAQNKKFEVCMKMLKSDSGDDFIKEFIDNAGQWAFLQCSAIVRLYGVILRSPVAMVMEYLPLGPLHVYLREHRKSLQVIELVEAASSLATALWHLTENGIVHGNIRCKKLLVANHDSLHFLIKLSEPGLHSEYDENAYHWIPVEFFNNMDLARIVSLADVWAFATTLWEIFSYGVSPVETNPVLTKKSYQIGDRLALPTNCPGEIYEIMTRCWLPDQYKRATPQVLMRDVNHLHYQVYNSRRSVYSSIMPKIMNGGSKQSISSDMTGDTQDTIISAEDIDKQYNSVTFSSSGFSAANTTITDCLDEDIADIQDFTTILSNLNMSAYSTSMNSVDRMQYVYDCEGFEVILQGKIGQGHYGEVYKGILERNDNTDPVVVAIKKLKTTAQHSLEDFEREIKIMRTLKHPNIVEILGVNDEPEVQLIMEYVQYGSLPTYLKISRQLITVNKLLNYAHDVALGMEYLGTKNIVHRDLAARNILVAEDNHVKISDFGLAQVMKGDYYILKTNRDLPLKWYAPESVSSGKFSTRSDVWSYGVTLWEMFSFGEEPPPWGAEPLAQDKLTRLPCPKFCPNEIYAHMMMPCWNFVPTERPTFSQLISECAKKRQYF